MTDFWQLRAHVEVAECAARLRLYCASALGASAKGDASFRWHDGVGDSVIITPGGALEGPWLAWIEARAELNVIGA